MDLFRFQRVPEHGRRRRAFASGADFVLAGMFDYEIDEDVKLAKDALGRTKERERAWKC